jgi:hypothetical protein
MFGPAPTGGFFNNGEGLEASTGAGSTVHTVPFFINKI